LKRKNAGGIERDREKKRGCGRRSEDVARAGTLCVLLGDVFLWDERICLCAPGLGRLKTIVVVERRPVFPAGSWRGASALSDVLGNEGHVDSRVVVRVGMDANESSVLHRE